MARRPALLLCLVAAVLLFAAAAEASTGNRLVIFRNCVRVWISASFFFV
ncbi:hypothetical protein IMZ48_02840 [Candidatus Bathyarchaeota archaeon]|nr:hypothetical protein [Candidatus Bathyarchaeota archaeon]